MSSEKREQELDQSYWNHYYKNDNAPCSPSDFAKFALQYMQRDHTLIDLGCGNGRDSIFFCENAIRVTAVDSAIAAINSIDKRKMPIITINDDFTRVLAMASQEYDYCYARWSLHAINEDQLNKLLPSAYNALKKEGLFYIEARTINDCKYGQGVKIGINEFYFDNHYRRFLNPEDIKKQLENLGFEIVYFAESDTFSIVQEDAPTLIRIVARKLR